jgi:hypothetical protein
MFNHERNQIMTDTLFQVLVVDLRQQQKFPLGEIVITRNAQQTIPADDVQRAVTRHSQADWGDLCDNDRRENELSLKDGYRLLSAYHAADGTKFWIITESDRSVTTVLLPEDY